MQIVGPLCYRSTSFPWNSVCCYTLLWFWNTIDCYPEGIQNTVKMAIYVPSGFFQNQVCLVLPHSVLNLKTKINVRLTDMQPLRFANMHQLFSGMHTDWKKQCICQETPITCYRNDDEQIVSPPLHPPSQKIASLLKDHAGNVNFIFWCCLFNGMY
jgi:hypothetical protein